MRGSCQGWTPELKHRPNPKISLSPVGVSRGMSCPRYAQQQNDTFENQKRRDAQRRNILIERLQQRQGFQLSIDGSGGGRAGAVSPCGRTRTACVDHVVCCAASGDLFTWRGCRPTPAINIRALRSTPCTRRRPGQAKQGRTLDSGSRSFLEDFYCL